MKELLIMITFMFHSPLFGGEWTNLSNLGTSLVSPKVESINDNVMISGNVGGSIPYIFKSIDRGETWEISLVDSIKRDETGNVIYHPRKMNDFKYMTEDNAFVMHEGTLYWNTSNGGETWYQDSIIDGSEGGVNRYINFNSNGYGVTSIYNLYLTKNWGKTFETFEIKSETDTLINKSVYDDLIITDDGLIFGAGYYIVKPYHEDNKLFTIISKDFGKTWEVSSILEKRMNAYTKLSNGNIVAVGSEQTKPNASTFKDIIQISTDGGYSWEVVLDTLSSPSSILWNVEFINDKDGITFSPGFSKLLRTSDGGRTWYRDYGTYDLPESPEDYAYLQNGEILAIDRAGVVSKWTDPILSIEDDKMQEEEPTAKLYPNPLSTNEELNIEFVPSFLGEMELSIIDMTGGKISTYQLNLASRTKQILNFKPNHDLTSGIYFLQIGYKNGIAERHKFVVE